MRTLRIPRIGDDVKADDVREMAFAIRENNVTAGLGLVEKQTPHGKVISLRQLNNPPSSSSTALRRTFDLEPSITAGKMKLVRCYFQIQDKFVYTNDEPEFTPSAGVLYAIINTASTPTQVTAIVVPIFTDAYNASTPELMPYALYIIDSSGGIVCDCRGMISIYG